MLRSLPLFAGMLLLVTGCGSPTAAPPPAAPAPPAPIAQLRSPAEAPPATLPAETPEETPPTVVTEAPPAVVPKVPSPAVPEVPPGDDAPTTPAENKGPVDSNPAIEEVLKLTAGYDFFNVEGNNLIRAKISELGDPGIEALLTLATSGTNAQRLKAMGFLPFFHDRLGEKNASKLIANLDPKADHTEGLRVSTILMLAQMGTKARGATPGVIAILHSGGPNSKNAACYALVQIGEPRDEIISAFIEALTTDEDLRHKACQALGDLHSKAAPAPNVVAGLKPLLMDSDKQVRELAARTFGDFGPAAKQAAPELTLALQDEVDIVRAEAAESLGKIGLAHPKVEAGLLSCLARDRQSATKAAQSLLELGISETVDPAPLLQALTHKHDLTRQYTAELLARIQPTDDKLPAVIAALVSALEDRFIPVGFHAHIALVKHAKNSRVAADELLKLLRSEEVSQRIAAAHVFVELGPAAKEQAAEAADVLFKLLRSEEVSQRLAAANVFASLDAAAKPYVTDLKKFAAEEKQAEVKKLLEIAIEDSK